jgi:5-methylcytosine-specific restriction enzyme subunit McrC
MPVSNQTRMFSVAGLPATLLEGFSQNYATSIEAVPSLVETFAAALVVALQAIDMHGVYREYIARAGDTSFPKGRLLVGETIQRHAAKGISHKVTVSWFHRGADIGPNQLLKYAVWLLAQKLKTPIHQRSGVRKLISQLNDAYALFRGVSHWEDRRFLADPAVINPDRMPPLRAYYKPAMRLALAVIGGKAISFDLPGEEVNLPALLLNLEEVFEEYLRNVLRRELVGRRDIYVLNGNDGEPIGAKKLLFDTQPSDDATPDIVLRRVIGPRRLRNELLVEVKYKWPDRDDYNQVITYAASFRCSAVVLAHPWERDKPKGLRVIGSIDSLNVYGYAVDLSATDLIGQEEEFAASMSTLVPP